MAERGRAERGVSSESGEERGGEDCHETNGCVTMRLELSLLTARREA